ncbi:T9SS type A sorting domain-containing protein [uncultured Microscilla sp.]|uniref:T9SS type A sorting domain-containing protein n=1 Tax=uncultured Microscilla sp. TaxID=432653 RepID=UPI0026227418|nr:T9SS type A sorting domain-containing protein [uncultured Microscilla sp.]
MLNLKRSDKTSLGGRFAARIKRSLLIKTGLLLLVGGVALASGTTLYKRFFAVNITPAANLEVCRGGEAKTLSKITILEGDTDFALNKSGKLILILSNNDVEMTGSPETKYYRGGTYQRDFTTVIRGNTLEIDYVFGGFVSQYLSIEITGLQVKATAGGTVTSVELKPKAGTTSDIVGLDENDVLANISVLEVPTGQPTISSSSPASLCLNTNGQTLEVNAEAGMSHEWELPNGITQSSFTANSITVDVNNSVPLGNTTIKVRKVNSNGCKGDWLNHNVTVVEKAGNAGSISTLNDAPYEGRVTVLTSDLIANADEYVWIIDQLLIPFENAYTVVNDAGTDRFQVITKTPRLAVKAGEVVSNTWAIAKLKGRNVCSEGNDNYKYINVRNLSGVVVENILKVEDLCIGGDYHSIGDIVLSEINADDLSSRGSPNTAASGTFRLEMTSTGYEFGGNPVTIFSEKNNGSFLGNFTTRISNNKQRLEIDYVFDNASLTTLNKMIISGLKIRAVAPNSTNSNIIIIPKVTSDFFRINDKVTLARVSRLDALPDPGSFTTSASVLCTNTDVDFAIGAVTGAAEYEWEFPDGITANSTDSPVSTSSPTVTLRVGTGAVNGKVRVRAVNVGGCKSNWLEQQVTIRSAPGVATGALGVGELFVGETATYEVTPIDGADEYVWTLSNDGLSSTDGISTNGPAGTTIITTTTNKITVTASSTVPGGGNNPTVLKVKGRSADCGDGVESTKNITIKPSGAVIVPAALNGICAGSSGILPDFTIKETFIKDFTGVGTLKFLPDDANFVLAGTPEVVASNGNFTPTIQEESIGGDLRKVLVLSYQFNAASENELSALVIKNLEVQVKAGTNATSTELKLINVDITSGDMKNLTNNTKIADLSSVVPPTISAADQTTFETATDACENTNFTLQVTGMTSVDSYEWQLPVGLAPVTTPVSTTQSIELKVSPGAQSGNVTVKVRGVNNAGCKGGWLEKTVAIKTAPNAPGNIIGANSICKGKSATYFVPPIAGADQYQWEIPAELSTSDVDVNADANIFATAANILTVTANSMPTGPDAPKIKLRVRGIKGGCDNAGAFAEYEITIFDTPGVQIKVGANDLIEGQTFASNADPIILTGEPAGGVFAATEGIVTTNGNQTAFDPEKAGLGGKTIKYTYTENGCSVTKEVGVVVVKATETGLSLSYCEYDSKQSFSIKRVTFDDTRGRKKYIHKLIAVPGLASKDPLDPTDVGVSGEIATNIPRSCGNDPSIITQATLVTDEDMFYTFDPSLVNGSVTIKAVEVEVRNGSFCDVDIIDLDRITVYKRPNPGAISGSAIVCNGSTATYKIPAKSGHTYKWSLPEGGTFVDGIDEGAEVKVNWAVANGDYKVDVTETNTLTPSNCNTPAATFDVTVKPLPAPHIVSDAGTNACANTTVTYKAAQDASGTPFGAGYTYKWTVDKGDGIKRETSGVSQIDVTWDVLDGIIALEVVSPASEGTCPNTTGDIPITVSTSLKPQLGTEVDADPSTGAKARNKKKTCAGSEVVYKLSSFTNQAGLTWKVTGGTIQDAGAENSTTPRTITAVDEIIVLWANNANGTIVIEENQGSCNGVENVSVEIVRPVKPVFAVENSYCKNDNSDITFAISNTLPAGTGQFRELIKDASGAIIDDIPFNNPFQPNALAIGEHNIVYRYTTDDGNCSIDSDPRTFKIEEPPTLLLSITGESDFDPLGNPVVPVYCISQGNITLEPKITAPVASIPGSNDGFIEVKKGSAVIKTLPNGNNTFNINQSITEGGEYTITYTYSTGCGGSASRTIQVTKPEAILIKAKKEDNTTEDLTSYCVRETPSVHLVPVVGTTELLNPALEDGKTYFMIRRLSGPKGRMTNFKLLKDIAGNLTNVLDVSNPIFDETPVAPDASTQEWNTNYGEYAVKYINGGSGSVACASQSAEFTVVLKRLPEIEFTGLNNDKTYCDDIASVPLEARDGQNIVPGAVFTYQKVFSDGSKGNAEPIQNGVFSPETVGAGTYEISVSHTEDGCSNSSDMPEVVTVTSVPKDIKVTATKVYHESSIQFTASSNNLSMGGQWSWLIDGSALNGQNPTKEFGNTEVKNVSYDLSVRTQAQGGCEKKISKEFLLDFDVSGFCAGGVTRFENKSKLFNDDKVKTITWNFGDKNTETMGTEATHSVQNYTYATPGTYWVTLTITTDDDIATYVLRRRVNIFKVITVTPQVPYLENFETDNGFWIHQGSVKVNQIPKDSTSWKWQTPKGKNIPANQGNVWVTDNNDNPHSSDSSSYNNNEQSYVESPCFDITALDKPMLSFKYWSDTDPGSDGVVLLYTVDDGKTWKRLGKQGDGLNWYDAKGVLGKPGIGTGADVNSGDQGWTGNAQVRSTKTWKVARFGINSVLNDIPANQAIKMVRFRIAFGSNADNSQANSYEGFAFDDIRISNRNRTVLLEYFINESVANAEAMDKAAKDFSTGGNANEVISIHHHTGFPAKDFFNEQNTKDPSARAFHHGIRAVPRGVVDGYAQDNTELDTWAQDTLATRILVESPFSIAITQPSVTGKKLTGSATITALESIDYPVVMHVVVIDTEATANGKTFYNVTRKMLPDAAGTYRTSAWAAGESQTLNFDWSDIGDLDPTNFKVVVFVEDYNSREVHQAATASVSIKRLDENQSEHEVTGVKDELLPSGALLFPNPVSDQVTVTVKALLSPKAQWQIWSITGKLLKHGQWGAGKQSMKIDVNNLSQGLYILRISDKGRTSQLRFEKL